jgi:hypothetical protein
MERRYRCKESAVSLPADIREELAAVGIFDPDPAQELHVRLVAAIERTRGHSRGAQLVAMQWVFTWDLRRYGREFAEAKTAYEVLHARRQVEFRDAGEKSGAMCATRADAMPDVAEAHLRYRLAEQLERLARKRLDTISNEIEVWRSENANVRAADALTARSS